MAARADILGDTGAIDPDHWVGGLAGEDLHAIAILFARTMTSSASARSRSTTSWWPGATACVVCRSWISTPRRRSTTRTTTSGSATGCRSR